MSSTTRAAVRWPKTAVDDPEDPGFQEAQRYRTVRMETSGVDEIADNQ